MRPFLAVVFVVFTCMPSESHGRRFRSFLLCSRDIFLALFMRRLSSPASSVCFAESNPHPLVNRAVEVNLADGHLGTLVLGTCPIRQAAHGARGQTHQGAGHAGRQTGADRVSSHYGVRTACNHTTQSSSMRSRSSA